MEKVCGCLGGVGLRVKEGRSGSDSDQKGGWRTASDHPVTGRGHTSGALTERAPTLVMPPLQLLPLLCPFVCPSYRPIPPLVGALDALSLLYNSCLFLL